jgi:hypothetical protein
MNRIPRIWRSLAGPATAGQGSGRLRRGGDRRAGGRPAAAARLADHAHHGRGRAAGLRPDGDRLADPGRTAPRDCNDRLSHDRTQHHAGLAARTHSVDSSLSRSQPERRDHDEPYPAHGPPRPPCAHE